MVAVKFFEDFVPVIEGFDFLVEISKGFVVVGESFVHVGDFLLILVVEGS